jgi:AraC-like DNA-binding protein
VTNKGTHFFHTFRRIFLKYFVLLLLLVGLMAPFIAMANRLSLNLALRQNTGRLNEGVTELGARVRGLQRIGSFLISDTRFKNLLLLDGSPSPRDYIDIHLAQQSFAKLCALQGALSSAYVVFRKNPVLLSNQFSSDHYETYYPAWFHYEGVSAQEWHDGIFAEPFTVKFISGGKFYNRYVSSQPMASLTCLVTNYLDTPYTGYSAIAGVFDREGILSALLYPDMTEHSFVYITDAEGAIVSETWMTRNVSPMVKLVLFYCGLGLMVIVAVALYFALKEAQTYREDLAQAEAMRASVLAQSLLNIFLLGVHSQYEERETMAYWGNSFDAFCVAACRFTLRDPSQDPGTLEDSKLRMERVWADLLQKRHKAVGLNQEEMALVVFLDPGDSSDVGDLAQQLEEGAALLRTGGKSAATVSVGLSRITVGVRNARRAFLQAKDALYVNEEPGRCQVYVYERPPSALAHKAIDLAALAKCCGFILRGDAAAVVGLMEDMKALYTKERCSESEKEQLFFSMRQPVYNAYVEILPGREDEDLTFPEYSGRDSLEAQFERLTAFAARLCEKTNSRRKRSNNQTADSVAAFIRENYTDVNLSAAMIADRFGLAEKYVFLLVKEKQGVPLGKWVEDLRVEHAEALLAASQDPIAKVGLAAGFGSENTFYRAFFRKHGVTPSVWRKKR